MVTSPGRVMGGGRGGGAGGGGGSTTRGAGPGSCGLPFAASSLFQRKKERRERKREIEKKQEKWKIF
jgi:hypothetical protein